MVARREFANWITTVTLDYPLSEPALLNRQINKTLKGQETMKNQSQTARLIKQMVLPFRSANEIHE
jgi:hypothetical protein